MFSTNIEKKSLDNKFYRKILYTDKFMQLVLMSIEPNDEIPLEKHTGSQFIRIEDGTGFLRKGKSGKKIILKDGISVNIPPNTLHHVKNTGKKAIKLYSIYSPPEHDANIKNH